MPDTGPHCTTCPRQSEQPICTKCRTETRRNLHNLPTLLTKLDRHLAAKPSPQLAAVTGRAGFGTRPAANMTALAMTAATTSAITRQYDHPQPPGHDTLSLPIWTAGWAGCWRARNTHHNPAPTRPGRLWSALRWNIRTPKPTPHNDPDSLAAAWATRFGTPQLPAMLAADLRYLTNWLDHAADTWPDTTLMVRQLRTLTAAGLATVGEPTDTLYLGRCPEPVLDRVTGSQHVTEDGEPEWCGVPLTHKTDDGPVVACPRCRTRTPERLWFNLAMRMRDVWGEVGPREAWQR